MEKYLIRYCFDNLSNLQHHPQLYPTNDYGTVTHLFVFKTESELFAFGKENGLTIDPNLGGFITEMSEDELTQTALKT